MVGGLYFILKNKITHNGTNKKNIYPTPVIGGVGLIKKLSKPLSHNFKQVNSTIILVGKTFGHIEQSCYLKEKKKIIIYQKQK